MEKRAGQETHATAPSLLGAVIVMRMVERFRWELYFLGGWYLKTGTDRCFLVGVGEKGTPTSVLFAPWVGQCVFVGTDFLVAVPHGEYALQLTISKSMQGNTKKAAECGIKEGAVELTVHVVLAMVGTP